jgi:two-component system response regulator
MAGTVELVLVEDNADDEELTRLTLTEARIVNEMIVLRDGAEALDYFFATGAHAERRVEDMPRVVLLDLKLPKVSGLEVLARLKSDPRTRDTPVVVLTSSREEPDVSQCYALGVNSYIVKPVDFAQFREAVRQLGLYWQILNVPPR